MQLDHKARFAASVGLFILLLCVSGPFLRAGTTPSDNEVAEEFVTALNRGDTGSMVAKSCFPFVFRNQEWESAKDGSGFVRGKAEDQKFDGKKALRSFLESLVKKTKIESEKAASSPPPKDALLADNFKNAPLDWTKLKLVVFTRGFGDVEHVAIVGVDRAKHKVQALYLN